MKATIRGTEYDTCNARYLGGYEVRPRMNPRHEVTEMLYQTRAGAYFTGRFGGDLTEYAAGELHPLTDAEASAWAHAHLDARRAAELFPAALSDQENKVTIALSLSNTDAAALLALLASALPAANAATLRGALSQPISQGI